MERMAPVYRMSNLDLKSLLFICLFVCFYPFIIMQVLNFKLHLFILISFELLKNHLSISDATCWFADWTRVVHTDVRLWSVLLFKRIERNVTLTRCDVRSREPGQVETRRQSLDVFCSVVCGLNSPASVQVKSGLWLEYNTVKQVLLRSPRLSLENILSCQLGGVSGWRGERLTSSVKS